MSEPPLQVQEGTAICEHAGHEWGDAGGGLLVCVRCDAEKWDDDAEARCPCNAPQSECQGCSQW